MDRDVELLAVGAGPSNLALAVALEELAPDDLAKGSLVVERRDAVEWQQGLLLPWAKSQVSFLKDLVTLRDPCSAFSFLSYLHANGRLDDFINMGSFMPYRMEISGYLQWVADSLSKVRVELGRTCTSIEPIRDGSGMLTGWLTQLADGTSITSRYLVIGTGRDPHVPPVLTALPAGRVTHSTQYRFRMADLPRDRPCRVAVVGSGQSAAEMFRSVQEDLPDAEVTWVMRSIGLRSYEMSKFINERYFPSHIDAFFGARPEGRQQILREMHHTNYSGLAPSLLESIYTDLYLERFAGIERTRIVTMTDITAAREVDDEVVLDLTDRRTGRVTELPCDLIFCGTGFSRAMPRLVTSLGAALGLDGISVTRHYRLVTDEPAAGACYLQGVNEATHGIADSLLSVLGHRAADIAQDILGHRAAAGTGHDGHAGHAGHVNGDRPVAGIRPASEAIPLAALPISPGRDRFA
ncbi:MAG: lysine N(6)-hydroxylase/L-ornithine N(5)-oxygenase family protein [Frankiaceae bacterium]